MQESWKNDLLSKDSKVRKRTVIAMAESRDPDALKILKFLHEKDADPQIRELAKKAGTHLWKTLQEQKVSAAPTEKIKKQQTPAAPQPQVKPQKPPAKAPASSAPTKRPTPPAKASAVPAAPVAPAKVPAPPAEAPATSAPTQRPAPSPAPTPKPARPVQAKPEPLPTDAFDLPDPQTELYLDDDENAMPSVDVNSKQIATARIHVARATALVVKGNRNEALYYLKNACQINPELQKEELVLNLAGELTGLPKNEALKSIMSMKGASATQNIGTPNRTLLYIGIGVGVVIVIAILAIFVF